MTPDCTGKTCTCGIGPWKSGGLCMHCGGTDLGLPALGGFFPSPGEQLTEAEVRRIVREELRRLVLGVARRRPRLIAGVRKPTSDG